MTLRLPVPSPSECDGLASDLTHAEMFSGGDPERVAIRSGYPTRCSARARDGYKALPGSRPEYRTP